MKDFHFKGHAAMLTANATWGLMSPLAKIVMAGGIVTPLVLTDLRIFGAMALFWIISFFQKPEHVHHKDMAKLLAASLLAIVFNQGCFIFGVGLTPLIRNNGGSIFAMAARGSHNLYLVGAAAASLVLTTLIIEVPFLANAFGFTPISWEEYAISLALAVSVIPIVEIIKVFQRLAARNKKTA